MNDISNLRKNIYSLGRQRKKIIDYLLDPRDMIEESIYTVYKKCGNKNCKCARGEIHEPFNYLSKKVGGVTKLTFVRRADEAYVGRQAVNYRKYSTHIAKLNKIDRKIYDTIAIIKKIKTSSYEPKRS